MYKGVKLKLRILYILVTAGKTQWTVPHENTGFAGNTSLVMHLGGQPFSSSLLLFDLFPCEIRLVVVEHVRNLALKCVYK